MRRLGIALLGATVWACVAPASAQAHEGWGIVRDSYGRIYFSDIPANTIWRIDADGRVEAVLRGIHSHALVVGADGAIYGTNVHLTEPIVSVWRLDMSGRLTTLVPPTHGFALNMQPFLMASDGTMYSVSWYQVALPPDQRQLLLLRRSANDVVDTLAGGLTSHSDGCGADARLSAIDGMAWLPDSSLLVVDGSRLRRITRDGCVTSLTGSLTDKRWDQDLMGTSVAADGAIYVADFSGRRIHRIDSNRRRTVIATGRYWAPSGVLATPGGVYLLEHARAPFGILGDLGVGAYLRVRAVRADGSTQVLSRQWGRHTELVAALAAGVTSLVAVLVWRRS